MKKKKRNQSSRLRKGYPLLNDDASIGADWLPPAWLPACLPDCLFASSIHSVADSVGCPPLVLAYFVPALNY